MNRLWATITIIAIVATVFGGQPLRFNYQARLTDSSGQPLFGTHTLYFSLWGGSGALAETADSGTSLYAERAMLSLVNGIATVEVGSGIPTLGTLDLSDFNTSTDIFLQVAVDTPSNVILPRNRLDSVPFAFTAQDSETLGHGTVVVNPNGNVGVAATDPSSRMDVNGTIRSRSGGFRFPDDTVQNTAVLKQMLNIRQYGAVGNGTTDDAPAIQLALNEAKALHAAGQPGAAVFVPPGRYLLRSSLLVESALLTGLQSGGWPADVSPQPHFIVGHDSPCIIAKAGASIHGLDFDYDHGSEQAHPFAPAIQLSGNGISITNIRMESPYEGIIADGTSNIGRLNIENVFIISARHTGLYVTATYDIPTLTNIEVWCTHPYSLQNCTAFKLGHNDEIRLTNCFAFSCQKGFHFINTPTGSTWGGMTGCSADGCGIGIQVDQVHRLRISGGSLWAHSTALLVNGPGQVTVSGMDLQANGDAALLVLNTDSTQITGCMIGKAARSPDWPATLARLEGGNNIIINGCAFSDTGPGLRVGSSAKNCIITNNVFEASQDASITSDPSSFRRIIDHNIRMDQ